MSDPRPLGVFDSGLGGLTVLRAVAGRLPAERLIYLGDTARVPYGTKSGATVTRYARQCAAFLRERGVKGLVVACNTASALAMDALRADLAPHGIPVMGVIEPGAVEACRLSRTGRVGVIGTASTLRSGAYARAIRAMRPDFTVVGAACPLFVPLAEEGWIDPDDPVSRQVALRYLGPLVRERIDTLILGCTHYPLLRSLIERALEDLTGGGSDEEIALVDSGMAVAQDLARLLESRGLEAPAAGRQAAGEAGRAGEYHVTDDPERFREVGARFLGHDIPGPHLADLTQHEPALPATHEETR
ncbi:MAG: glutamate racemase [Candidatus Polarisedimenticolia bacterium]